jgi:hypothetical protein
MPQSPPRVLKAFMKIYEFRFAGAQIPEIRVAGIV